MTNPNIQEVYDGLTADLITQLQNNPASWTKPFVSIGQNTPHNPISGTIYQGSNWVLLSLVRWNRDYKNGKWATYKQWNSVDCQVRKGEKATKGINWSPRFHCLDCKKTSSKKCEIPSHEIRSFMKPNLFFIFNADQVEGDTESVEHPDFPARQDLVEPNVDEIREAFNRTGSNWTEGGDSAHYVPAVDKIRVPEAKQFATAEGFASTLGHEHGHWTGHKSRLNRDLEGRFGDESYAFEELIAELTAVFICNRLGIAHEADQNHASYLQSWLKALQGEDGASRLWKAAGDASKAANYIFNLMEENADQEKKVLVQA